MSRVIGDELPPDGDGDAEFNRRHALFQQAWDLVHDAEQDLRRRRWRAGWWKRVTVCWWAHHTRRLDDGVYLSHSCWACTKPGG